MKLIRRTIKALETPEHLKDNDMKRACLIAAPMLCATLGFAALLVVDMLVRV